MRMIITERMCVSVCLKPPLKASWWAQLTQIWPRCQKWHIPPIVHQPPLCRMFHRAAVWLCVCPLIYHLFLWEALELLFDWRESPFTYHTCPKWEWNPSTCEAGDSFWLKMWGLFFFFFLPWWDSVRFKNTVTTLTSPQVGLGGVVLVSGYTHVTHVYDATVWQYRNVNNTIPLSFSCISHMSRAATSKF